MGNRERAGFLRHGVPGTSDGPKYEVLAIDVSGTRCRNCGALMTPIVSFKDLDVWQRGMDLIVSVYRMTEPFPSRERFGLVSQIRRASVSIPANVAEGHGRGEGSYLNHVRIAIGSQAELATEIEAAIRLGFVSAKTAAPVVSEIDEVRRMLYGLRGALERRRQARFGSCLLALLIAVWWIAP